MKITISLPPPPLYPNWRALVPWPKVKAIKAYRFEAATLARLAIGVKPKPRWDHATASVVVFHPSLKHFRDPDNMAAALKPVWDGFQDAELLTDDRRLHLMPIEQDVNEDTPHIEIEIIEGHPPRKGDIP